MSSNEGPQRLDFTEAALAPSCGAGCEHHHGDQAYSEDELELFTTRAEVERLKNLLTKLTDGVSIWRRLVWLRHGCLALYGDDGEMQCGACGLDFKRMEPGEIEARFHEIGVEKMVRGLAQGA